MILRRPPGPPLIPLLLLASLLSLFAPAGLARASLVVALDTPSMVERADLIAVVDVVSVKAAWDDKHERILTTIDLSVVETWKGGMAPATHVKVVQPGGTVDDLTLVVFGMSRFSRGERALVFLAGRPEEASVVGMAQGKRMVRRDAAGGGWVVHVPDRAGASFVRTLPARPLVSSTPAAASASIPILELHARPLDAVRTEVRDLVARAKTR